jgi:hypothetical protein
MMLMHGKLRENIMNRNTEISCISVNPINAEAIPFHYRPYLASFL